MVDYNNWCRVCGSLSSLSEIDEEIVALLVDVFNLDPPNFIICLDCHQCLLKFSSLVTTSRSLSKMFSGLDAEDKFDLDILRLNAYRTHFQLAKISPESENDESDAKIESFVEESFKEETKESHSEEFIPMEDVIEEFIVDTEEPEESKEEITYEEVTMTDEEEEEDSQQQNYAKFFSFLCHVCNQEYVTFRALKLHCKNHHDTVPSVKCCDEKCNKYLATWRRLVIHKEKHFPTPGVLKCEKCHRVFNTEKGFERHQQSHARVFICSHCPKSFGDKKILRFHEATHEADVDDRRNFQCSHCGKKFVSKQACQTHIGQKHEQVVSFYCQHPDCKKGFFTQKALCEHKRVHEERKYKCEHCSFMAKTKSALHSHNEKHLTEIISKCSVCGIGFTSKRRLNNHMVTHTDETPFHCTECSAKFKRKKDLNNHLNTHSGVKAFKCTFCPRTFTNGSNCRKHKVKDHPVELKVYEEKYGTGRKLDCYA